MKYSFFQVFFKSWLKKNIDVDIVQRIKWTTKFISQNDGKIKVKRGCNMLRNVTIHSDGGEIIINRGTFINENVKVVSHEKIIIGEKCTIGPNVVIYDHDHAYKNKMQGYVSTSVLIEKGVWIGANSIILRGAYIEENAVIAAGSIVKGRVPKNSVYYSEKKVIIKGYKIN